MVNRPAGPNHGIGFFQFAELELGAGLPPSPWECLAPGWLGGVPSFPFDMRSK